MASGGGAVPRPPRAQASAKGGRRKHQTPSLPLDIVVEIAARSDPATLVRCAATCTDVRRRFVADDGGRAFRRRLRLRHADRFVPSLLRGHLEFRYVAGSYTNTDLHLVDITAAETTTARLLTAADGFPPRTEVTDGKTVRRRNFVASRDGLFLVRTTEWQPPNEQELGVWDPATGRSRTLPPEPAFPDVSEPTSRGTARNLWEPYVLLVGDGDGDGAAGGIRPFQVLKANLVMSKHHRYLQTQTFSSETGVWGRYTEIRTPYLHGSSLLWGGKPMVAGGAPHWLCITNSDSYVVKLDITTAQVTVAVLPASFPRSGRYSGIDYLLTTSTASAAGGVELMVLVADNKKKNISAWVQMQTKPPMAKWKQRSQVVLEYEAMLRFRNTRWMCTFDVKLHWFAERSGLVLFSSHGYGEFWLDIRSMEIVRWFPAGSSPCRYGNDCLPYEMNLSSWAPTFTGAI